ncbi:unnamed protein product, partial [Cladocopium goreaui]
CDKTAQRSMSRGGGTPNCPCGMHQLTTLPLELQTTWEDKWEYQGTKWRGTPGGQALWLYCLECHQQRWPQDVRNKNRWCKPKGPAAVTPPPHQGSRVMRADGSWFHLTSPPPEAGNLALVQDHFFFCLGCCGQVVPSATQTPPQKKRKLQRQARRRRRTAKATPVGASVAPVPWPQVRAGCVTPARRAAAAQPGAVPQPAAPPELARAPETPPHRLRGSSSGDLAFGNNSAATPPGGGAGEGGDPELQESGSLGVGHAREHSWSATAATAVSRMGKAFFRTWVRPSLPAVCQTLSG